MSEILYFAYGSNLLRERLLARCPGLTYAGRATLPAHRLAFDKVSVDGSGKCAFEPTANCEVNGVLWNVPAIGLDKLDLLEGVGSGYERDHVKVAQSDGVRKVLAYRATNRRAELLPYDWYLALVLAGAEQQALPQAYIDALRASPHRVDTQMNRRTRLDALAALGEAGLMKVLYGLSH